MVNKMLPLRLGASERYVVGVASVNSSVAPAGVSFFRMVALTGAGIHIDVGTAPTALATHAFIPPNREQYFRISAGERVAAIRTSTDGTVILTWMFPT